MSERIRIGIIGAGARGSHAYIRHFKEYKDDVVLAAVADPYKRSAEKCIAHVVHQETKPVLYADWREMLEKEERFDGLIIACPNYLHHEAVIGSIEKGVRAIALEKPLATNERDCEHIVKLAQEKNVAVQLGFCLRSAPFYRKVKEILESKRIGRLITIQATEFVNFNVTSILFRSPWRRYRKFSGGTILEKCCHDFDLLNWFIGARPLSLNSYGGNALFKSCPFLPRRCAECSLKDNCRYAKADRHEKDDFDRAMAQYLPQNDICIYDSDTDCADHQSVQILYENDVICNFLMNYNTDGPQAGRSIHIIGAGGRIWGNLDVPVVFEHNNVSGETTEHKFILDGSGHHGGDQAHIHGVMQTLKGETRKPAVGTYEGYLSAMICFAADRSMLEGRRVHFRYPGKDTIEII